MNLSDLLEKAVSPPVKVSRTTPNVANQIREHLRIYIPEAFEVDGVWITGSNVWKFLYGETPDLGSDIDVICENIATTNGDLIGPARSVFRTVLGATHVTDCKPSLPCDVQGNGSKYESKGRTIDMWDATDSVIGSLERYSEHSHAHCRAAYNCKTGVLIVLPNLKAP